MFLFLLHVTLGFFHSGNTSWRFSIVDKNGYSDQSDGLLIADNGNVKGSVCQSTLEDSFTDRSARVMCLDMGYSGCDKWELATDQSWDTHDTYPIVLSYVWCVFGAKSYKQCVYYRYAPDDCDHKSNIIIACSKVSCTENTYYNKELDQCEACPSDSTSKPSSVFCNCQAEYYWNSDQYACSKCPTNATSEWGSKSCECSTGYYWEFDLHQCLKWTFTLIDQYGNLGLQSGLFVADNGRTRGTMCDGQRGPDSNIYFKYSNSSAMVNCKDMGFTGYDRWWYGKRWDIQESYPVILKDFVCNGTDASYKDCVYTETDTKSSLCNHNFDIFISCTSTPCPANTYYSNKTCEQCPNNATSNPNSTYCHCPPSHYWSSNHCAICPVGSTSKFGARSCECPAGQVWNTESGQCLALRFTLIAKNGAEGMTSGLLVVNIGSLHGTVCTQRYDGLEKNTADVICLDMGYVAAYSWSKGKDHVDREVQSNYSAVMTSFMCGTQSVTDCRYLTGSNYLYECDRDTDVFLRCITCPENTFYDSYRCSKCPGNTTSKPNSLHCDCPSGNYWDSLSQYCLRYSFMLVDKNGTSDVTSGLLLATNGQGLGTICNDRYSNNTARVNCIDMGFSGFEKWWYGREWNIQKTFSIFLNEFVCDSSAESYTDCSYVTNHDCRHDQDIFVSCVSCVANTYYNKKLGKCVVCPSESTSKPNSIFCFCPAGNYWNSDYHDCIKCPINSTSTNEAQSCACTGDLHWNFDHHMCLKWSFELVDKNGSSGVDQGLLMAYNGYDRGILATCGEPSMNHNSVRVICSDMGYVAEAPEVEHLHWRIQYSYPVVISNMDCDYTAATYRDCTYHTGPAPNCIHPLNGVYISCVVCPVNSYFNRHEYSCTPCRSGATSAPSSYSCDCSPGQFWSSIDKTCDYCPENYYSNRQTVNCTMCPTFRVAPMASSSCSKCRLGYYWSNYTCVKCEDDLYGDGEKCMICPPAFQVRKGKCVRGLRDLFEISENFEDKVKSSKLKDTVITVLVIIIIIILFIHLLIFMKNKVTRLVEATPLRAISLESILLTDPSASD